MKKLIIGLPGLTHKDEEGRLEQIAGNFPNHDFIKVSYPGIERKGNKIIIPFSIEDFLSAVKIPSGYDQIGVIASSTGAAVFSQYLSTNQNVNVGWYVAISPFYKLNSIARSQVTYLKTNGQDLNIGSSQLQRIIPNKYLGNILNLDSNSSSDTTKISHVLTLLGDKDEIIDFEEGIKHHYKFGGSKANLIIYKNTNHCLNDKSTRDAVDFIRAVSERVLENGEIMPDIPEWLKKDPITHRSSSKGLSFKELSKLKRSRKIFL